MKYPKVNVSTGVSEQADAQYICFLAKGICLGEYQNNGFCVLPYLSKNNSKSVYFPDLPYSKSFWKYIQNNTNKNLSGDFPKYAVDEVCNLLKSKEKEKINLELNKIKNDWLKIEKGFFTDVVKFLNFEKELNKIDEINILITPFGTISSFNPPRVGNKFKLFVTSRIDMPAGNIAVSIIQNLFIIKNHLGGEINTNEYVRRMAAISFLFKDTCFSKYNTNYKDLLNENYEYNQKENIDSKKFLEKLGFPEKETKINLNDTNLTKQEVKVLILFIKNKGKVTTFDEVAECIWQNEIDNKFSLEAISKIIQNLRNKLRNQGITKEVIFTKRGSGYLLLK